MVCTVKPHLQAKREIKELFSSRIIQPQTFNIVRMWIISTHIKLSKAIYVEPGTYSVKCISRICISSK